MYNIAVHKQTSFCVQGDLSCGISLLRFSVSQLLFLNLKHNVKLRQHFGNFEQGKYFQI